MRGLWFQSTVSGLPLRGQAKGRTSHATRGNAGSAERARHHAGRGAAPRRGGIGPGWTDRGGGDLGGDRRQCGGGACGRPCRANRDPWSDRQPPPFHLDRAEGGDAGHLDGGEYKRRAGDRRWGGGGGLAGRAHLRHAHQPLQVSRSPAAYRQRPGQRGAGEPGLPPGRHRPLLVGQHALPGHARPAGGHARPGSGYGPVAQPRQHHRRAGHARSLRPGAGHGARATRGRRAGRLRRPDHGPRAGGNRPARRSQRAVVAGGCA